MVFVSDVFKWTAGDLAAASDSSASLCVRMFEFWPYGGRLRLLQFDALSVGF